MYKLIDADKAVGKIVEEVKVGDAYIATLFEDGTAILMHAGEDLYDGTVEACVMTKFPDYDYYLMKNIGIITPEECESMKLKWKEQKELQERETYERLKNKFETEATG